MPTAYLNDTINSTLPVLGVGQFADFSGQKLSIEKGILRTAQKIRPWAAKMLQKDFLALKEI